MVVEKRSIISSRSGGGGGAPTPNGAPLNRPRKMHLAPTAASSTSSWPIASHIIDRLLWAVRNGAGEEEDAHLTSISASPESLRHSRV